MLTLYEKKTTDFVFNHLIYDNAKDKNFAMHSHGNFELIYVFRGEVEYTIENKKFYIKPGDLILIKPLAYHCFTITSNSDYEKIGVQINTALLGVEPTINDTAEVFSVGEGIIKDNFVKISAYYKLFSEKVFFDMLFPLVKEIIYNFELLEKNTINTFEHLPKYVSQAISYINENLFTINSFAVFSISSSNFGSSVKSEYFFFNAFVST